MGFFDSLNTLIDNIDKGGLDKTLLGGLDKVEGVLKTTLDTAEQGLSKAGNVVETVQAKAVQASDRIDTVVQKIPHNNDKV